MGTGLIFPGQQEVTNRNWGSGLIGLARALGLIPGNSSCMKTVPETDTGGQVEHTKALERTMLKELGKLPP